MTTTFIAALALLSIIAVIAFIIGWNMAVAKWRKRQLALAVQYDQMAAKWKVIADAMDQDPMKAGLDTGQRFILDEFDKLIIEHRKRLANP